MSNTQVSQFCNILQIQKCRIAPYNSKANPAERLNRVLIEGLRTAQVEFQLDFDKLEHMLNFIVLCWNSSLIPRLGFSPARLHLSTDLDLTDYYQFLSLEEVRENDYGRFVENLVKSQALIEKMVNSKYSSIRQERYQKHNEATELPIYRKGTLVLVRYKTQATQRAHKLRPKFKGPFRIVKDKGKNHVVLLPWSPSYRRKFERKYKFQSVSDIPVKECFIVHKSNIQLAPNTTNQLDDQLGRKFIKLFWNSIDDATPVEFITLDKPDKSKPITYSTIVTPPGRTINYNSSEPRPRVQDLHSYNLRSRLGNHKKNVNEGIILATTDLFTAYYF